MAILLNTCKILTTSKTKNMKSYFFSSKNKILKYIKLCEMLTVAENASKLFAIVDKLYKY